MSDEFALVDREPQPQSRCHNDKDHLLDTVSYFAIGFVFVGLVFSAIGFLYPRDVDRDPQASAEENEKLEVQYMELKQALNAVVVAGLIMTGIGGLILSAIFTNTVVCRECRRDDENRTFTSRQMTSRRRAPSVGSVVNSADGNTNYGAVAPGSPE